MFSKFIHDYIMILILGLELHRKVLSRLSNVLSELNNDA